MSNQENKKIEFVKKTLKIDDSLLNKVLDFCLFYNKDNPYKFLVWIAKETKKQPDIISLKNRPRLITIIDWVHIKKPNILSYSYKMAEIESDVYHHELTINSSLIKPFKKISEESIVYKCSDKVHTLVKLNPHDLKVEGALMGHCIGTNTLYADRLRKGYISVYSIRDDKNYPHVTIEIDNELKLARQISGKGNKPPVPRYGVLIAEIAMCLGNEADEIKQKKTRTIIEIIKD